MRGIGILLNDDYDLQITPLRDSSGKITEGLQIGGTLYQNQAVILICHTGEITEKPELGVGLEDMLLDNDYLYWKRKIRLNMRMDEQTVNDVKFSENEKLKIDAYY